MHEFDYVREAGPLLTVRVTGLLSAIHEAKGCQNVQASMAADRLDALVRVARIQSADASNRIEGIATSDRRLADLMSQKTTPRNRDEEEIAGYRDVLALIHENHEYIPLTANAILQLHRDLFRHTPLSFGGHFKDADNVIVERDEHGRRTVRFVPPSALVAPELVEAACEEYRSVVAGGEIDPLLAICMFVFDFICIHPFNDGNGRMSRLLMLLLLYNNGYMVGKYISLEHEIERSKDSYYDALAASTVGWADNANDVTPFVEYLLGVVLAAYREFDDRMAGEDSGVRGKEARVAMVFEQTLEPLSKKDVLQRLPDVSVTTVERALKRLLDAGAIAKIGAGRATRYVRR